MWDQYNQMGWDEVTVLKKKKASNSQIKKDSALKNKNIEIKRKNVEGNKKNNTDLNTRKLDESDEPEKHKEVGLTLGQEIQKARAAKGLKQKDLANRINEKVQVITEYEQGKAIPNNQILGKLERILDVKLRGKKKK